MGAVMKRHQECAHENVSCINSRRRDGYRYRRYLCGDCGYRYSTVEIQIDRDKRYQGHAGGLLRGLNNQLAQGLGELYGLSPKQLDAVKNLLDVFTEEI